MTKYYLCPCHGHLTRKPFDANETGPYHLGFLTSAAVVTANQIWISIYTWRGEEEKEQKDGDVGRGSALTGYSGLGTQEYSEKQKGRNKEERKEKVR